MSVRLICPPRFGDSRGWFSETWSRRRLAEDGIDNAFCQDNQSYSRDAFTLRGLHFQRQPSAQAKLVRCVRGRIFDVAADVRQGSPTFGKWVGAVLTAAEGNQLFVPAGFAHGFLTLEPDCEVAYKVDAYYDPATDGGIAWDDPDVGVKWPIPPGTTPILSDKDKALPKLGGLPLLFEYDGEPLAELDEGK